MGDLFNSVIHPGAIPACLGSLIKGLLKKNSWIDTSFYIFCSFVFICVIGDYVEKNVTQDLRPLCFFAIGFFAREVLKLFGGIEADDIKDFLLEKYHLKKRWEVNKNENIE